MHHCLRTSEPKLRRKKLFRSIFVNALLEMTSCRDVDPDRSAYPRSEAASPPPTRRFVQPPESPTARVHSVLWILHNWCAASLTSSGRFSPPPLLALSGGLITGRLPSASGLSDVIGSPIVQTGNVLNCSPLNHSQYSGRGELVCSGARCRRIRAFVRNQHLRRENRTGTTKKRDDGTSEMVLTPPTVGNGLSARKRATVGK
jgi:hypothetical protein